MKIDIGMTELKFMLLLRVYTRKVSKHLRKEEIKEAEFKRLSEFRPLPVVDKSNRVSEKVEEAELVDFEDVGTIEEEIVRFQGLRIEEAFSAQLEDDDVEDLMNGRYRTDGLVGVIDRGSSVKVGSVTADDDDMEGLSLASAMNIQAQYNTYGDYSDDDDDSNYENEDDDSDYLDTEVYYTTDGTFTTPLFESSVSNISHNEVMGILDSGATLTLKNNGKTKPATATVKPVKPEVDTKYEDLYKKPVYTYDPIANKTKTDRLENEDLISYARRLVRVSEADILRQFPPRELEIALGRGQLLRKSGIIIFAHS